MELLSLLFSFLALLKLVLALGQKASVTFNATSGGLQLAGGSGASQLVRSGNDWPGVLRAGGDLAMDFGRVTGTNLTMTMVNGTSATMSMPSSAGSMIIAGTIGNSTLIDSMMSSGKINVSQVEGKWESLPSRVESDGWCVFSLGHRWTRQKRHHLWIIRPVRTNRSLTMILVRRRRPDSAFGDLRHEYDQDSRSSFGQISWLLHQRRSVRFEQLDYCKLSQWPIWSGLERRFLHPRLRTSTPVTGKLYLACRVEQYVFC